MASGALKKKCGGKLFRVVSCHFYLAFSFWIVFFHILAAYIISGGCLLAADRVCNFVDLFFVEVSKNMILKCLR